MAGPLNLPATGYNDCLTVLETWQSSHQNLWRIDDKNPAFAGLTKKALQALGTATGVLGPLTYQAFHLCVTDHICIGVHIHFVQNMSAMGADSFNT